MLAGRTGSGPQATTGTGIFSISAGPAFLETADGNAVGFIRHSEFVHQVNHAEVAIQLKRQGPITSQTGEETLLAQDSKES